MTQDDNLIGTLTVRETISYSARLRLPDKMPWSEKRALVESTIIEMGLQDCADTVVGNWHLRGISGGEKRRVSIALEILMRPRLLFLDEPTSGLDRLNSKNFPLHVIANFFWKCRVPLFLVLYIFRRELDNVSVVLSPSASLISVINQYDFFFLNSCVLRIHYYCKYHIVDLQFCFTNCLIFYLLEVDRTRVFGIFSPN